jgi:O-antigen/teichoic acid export membrane protein
MPSAADGAAEPAAPRSAVSRSSEGARTMSRLATVAAVLASYGLCRLVFNAVGLRRLGAETVGTVNIALSMAVLVSLPVSAGLAPALSRFLPLLPGEASRSALRRWALGTGAAWLAAPAALFLIIVGLILGFPYAPSFAPIVLLWSALYAMYALCRAELFASDAPGRALVLEAAGVTLFGAGLLLLFTTGWGRWLPFSVYYLPAVAWIGSRALGSRAGVEAPIASREVRAFAGYSLMGSAASLGIAYFTTVVVSASSGLAAAGLWATLLSVAAPLLLAPRTLNSSFFPRLSLLGRTDPESFRRLCRLHHHFSSLLALGSVGGALVLAGPILRIAVGEDSAGALGTSWILVGVASYDIFRGEPLITSCAALGRARLTALAAFFGAGVCAALWTGLLPRAGMAGVAAGYLAYTLVTPVVVLIASRRRGPAPPVFLFPSDAAFAVVVALVAAGITGDVLVRIAGLALIVAVLAIGLVRIRRELRDLHLDAPARGAEMAAGTV